MRNSVGRIRRVFRPNVPSIVFPPPAPSDNSLLIILLRRRRSKGSKDTIANGMFSLGGSLSWDRASQVRVQFGSCAILVLQRCAVSECTAFPIGDLEQAKYRMLSPKCAIERNAEINSNNRFHGGERPRQDLRVISGRSQLTSMVHQAWSSASWRWPTTSCLEKQLLSQKPPRNFGPAAEPAQAAIQTRGASLFEDLSARGIRHLRSVLKGLSHCHG